MSIIDPRTVILIASIMSALMSLVLYYLKRGYPASIKGLGEWSAALLLLFVAGLLFGGRGKLPNVLSISLANTLIWSGIYLTYIGSQRFFGVAPRMKPWIALILSATLVLGWFTYVEPDYRMRLVSSGLMMAFLFGVHGLLILKQGVNKFPKILAFIVLAGTTATHVMRVVTSFTSPFGAELFETAPQQQIYLTSHAFLILMMSISLVLMATERLRTELEHLATHDSLTNALTRRHMNEACQEELARCRRYGRNMALLMMDMDHFKAINDTYGHQAGDRVLVNFVAKVNALLRGPDQLGRFGGEEFLVLLPDTALEEAIVVAERIRANCAEPSTEPSCTVSIGITVNKTDTDTMDALLARADAAMYQAKTNGRNRVETA